MTTTPLPQDLFAVGVRLPAPGHDGPVFVAPRTLDLLLRHRFATGPSATGSLLAHRVADALVAAGWAEPTATGHVATGQFEAAVDAL